MPCCTHVSIWKAKWLFWKHQVQAAAIGATYSWTTTEAFEKHCVLSTHVRIWKALAVLEGPSASCCHWSNIQLNHNWSCWEALCAKSIWKQNGKMFQWKHYVLNACTCLCTWINDWLCNMENMFLLHTRSCSKKLFSSGMLCCKMMLTGQSQGNQTKNTTQQPKAKWAKLAKILAHLSILG